jgi:cobalt/nickel transport system permease protein
MRHDFLDKWSRLDSPIHRAPTALKLALALATVVTSVVTPLPLWWAFVAIGSFLSLVALASRVPTSFLAGRLVLLEPLAAGIALLSAFQPGGAGIALSILVRSTLCLATMILLTSTTPFAELLRALRALRVPDLLVTVLALMYRYLFVLVDEAERMQRARRSRTFTRRRTHAWESLASLVGQLFVRSTERAERIYAAMCARGWR